MLKFLTDDSATFVPHRRIAEQRILLFNPSDSKRRKVLGQYRNDRAQTSCIDRIDRKDELKKQRQEWRKREIIEIPKPRRTKRRKRR